ncbi:MAG: M24 family metallopeptidase [Patescibacteria group bacterium]|nr:M24 family metallopeptidase [Patescibacteria group bacterium]
MPQIKTKEEILKIKKACNLTDNIFSNILQNNLKMMTELELRDFILSEIKKRGLRPSFKPIVTSGPQAGNEIHPFNPTMKKLSGFVIIDFGVVYQKYMSDMTRTIYVGTPSQKEKDTYNKLLTSQIGAIKMGKIGARCSDLDLYVREFLGKDNKYFIHTLGHGVGTRIHESPRLYFKKTRPKLKENMIITIEPGIYIKNKLGIRIEDTCLITKKRCIPLTKSPKELIVIK